MRGGALGGLRDDVPMLSIVADRDGKRCAWTHLLARLDGHRVVNKDIVAVIQGYSVDAAVVVGQVG